MTGEFREFTDASHPEGVSELGTAASRRLRYGSARMRLSLVPRTSEFYDLFTAAGEARSRPRAWSTRFRAFPERECDSAIKELENKGDDLTRQIIRLLNTQYITPFDREDIYELAKAIDDVVDFIENASGLLTLYKVDRPVQQSLQQCGLLVEAAEHLCKALAGRGRATPSATSSMWRRSKTRRTALRRRSPASSRTMWIPSR